MAKNTAHKMCFKIGLRMYLFLAQLEQVYLFWACTHLLETSSQGFNGIGVVDQLYPTLSCTAAVFVKQPRSSNNVLGA